MDQPLPVGKKPGPVPPVQGEMHPEPAGFGQPGEISGVVNGALAHATEIVSLRKIGRGYQVVDRHAVDAARDRGGCARPAH